MQQQRSPKQPTALWRKSLALLSLLALVWVSAATVGHIHSGAVGSPAGHDCVLCLAGGQSPALAARTPTVSAHLLAVSGLCPAANDHAPAGHHRPAFPRGPPVGPSILS